MLEQPALARRPHDVDQQGGPRGRAHHDPVDVEARRPRLVEHQAPRRVVADHADQRDRGPELPARAGLVRALAAEQLGAPADVGRTPGVREPVDRQHQVAPGLPDHHDPHATRPCTHAASLTRPPRTRTRTRSRTARDPPTRRGAGGEGREVRSGVLVAPGSA